MKLSGKWIAAVLVPVVMGGCAHNGARYKSYDDFVKKTQQDDEPSKSDAILAGALAGVGLIASAPEVNLRDFRPEKEPKRVLQTVQGRLLDLYGEAIPDATITIRRAPHVVKNPETLPATIVHSKVDGTYGFSMAKGDVVCVDVEAPGAETVRQWFVALTPSAVRRLPKDRRGIMFIPPELKVCKLATMVIKRS